MTNHRLLVRVIGAVALFYLVTLALTFWPQKRQSNGEFSETGYGEWEETD